jgi:hypothetical protein
MNIVFLFYEGVAVLGAVSTDKVNLLIINALKKRMLASFES